MKEFFKTTFACVLGALIAGIASVALIVVIIIGATSGEQAYTPMPNSVYSLMINSAIIERQNSNPLEALNTLLDQSEPKMSLEKILDNIEKAQNHPYVAGIYLNTDNLTAGMATVEAIRNKLIDFKRSGKFIIAYNDFYTQGQYYLASVADSIYANPVGNIGLQGLSINQMFFKNALDKLGVQTEVFRVGTFKSAVEPFINEKMSPANREQLEVYLNSVWGTIISGISDSREVPADTINNWANRGIDYCNTMNLPADISSKLITGCKYREEMLSTLEYMIGADVTLISNSNMSLVKNKTKELRDKIAVIYAVGEIANGKTKDGIYWKETIKDIQNAQNNDQVKAVVIRVNSPGGSAFASEQIWAAIEQLKTKKPVVTSMGDYAASGGYYISCNSDYIIAEPTTLTGSIGVFGMIFNAKNLLTNKLGINTEEVKTNKFGEITVFNPVTPAERNLIQNSVERTYELFLNRCAEGRNMPVDSIAKIAEGRIWTGSMAMKLGLVDEMGGIDNAINKAGELAGISSFSVVRYPKEKEFMEILTESIEGSDNIAIGKQILGEDYKYVEILNYIRSLDKIQARCDYFDIK